LGIPVELVQFLLNLCWNRDFLLCTTISSDCSQISFPWRWGVGKFGKAGVGVGIGSGNFGKSEPGVGFGNFGTVGIGVGYFTYDFTTLLITAAPWPFR